MTGSGGRGGDGGRGALSLSSKSLHWYGLVQHGCGAQCVLQKGAEVSCAPWAKHGAQQTSAHLLQRPVPHEAHVPVLRLYEAIHVRQAGRAPRAGPDGRPPLPLPLLAFSDANVPRLCHVRQCRTAVDTCCCMSVLVTTERVVRAVLEVQQGQYGDGGGEDALQRQRASANLRATRATRMD